MQKRLLIGPVFLIALCVSTLHGQTQGQITGEVTDQSGGAIVGASVVVKNEGTNVTRQMNTNPSGVYSFPSLPPGMYQIQAEMTGFQTMLRSGVELQVQQVARVDFRMQVGQISQVVEVSGQASLLTTESATTGTVVETRRIVDLPLNGRNFLQLVSLSPNVSYGFGSAGQQVSMQGGQRSQQNISVSGMRSEYNHFTLDGVENTDPNWNSYVFLPSVDALEEFKVQTGIYPAEFGRSVSQINVSTKPGTNVYHGALFEFFRNAALDAKNYRFVDVEVRKDPFVRNQYGFTLGGPVWIPKVFNGKDRLFFMANYEGLRDRTGRISTADLPTAALRAGNFAGQKPIYDPKTRVRVGNVVVAQLFPGNVVPPERFNAKAIKLMDMFYPLPNVETATMVRNYQTQRVTRQDGDQFTARIDFAETASSNWSGRYSWDSELDIRPGTFVGVGGTVLNTNVKQAMLSNTRMLTPTIVNEFRFGVNDLENLGYAENAYKRNVIGEIGGLLGIAPPVPALFGVPSIGITGFSGFGDSGTDPNFSNNQTFQWIDNLSIVRGRHSIRFGAEIRRDRFNQQGNQQSRGVFSFSGQATQHPTVPANTGNGFADYLLGVVRNSSGSLGMAVAQLRGWRESAYVDDIWKITPKLTLNIGLRYEYTPPYIHKNDNMINTQIFAAFDPTRHPVIVRAGSGDFYEGLPFRYTPDIQIARDGRLGRALVRNDRNDFAPRIGLAYNPTQKWTVRTGFGAFYTQDIGNTRYDTSRNLFVRRNETSNTDFPDLTLDVPFANAGSVTVSFPLILSNHVDRRTPYVLQWLLNIQRQLTATTMLEVGYAGNEGHKLERFRHYNIPTPGPGSVQSRRPYPELGLIQMTDGVVNSNYHALAFKFQQRFSAGFTTLVSHTFSKSIDLGSAIRTHSGETDFPQDNYNIQGWRGVSTHHQKQRFVVSLLWEPPLGKGKSRLNQGVSNYVLGNWQLGTIFTYRTGMPYTMQNGQDDANNGWGGQTPNRTSASLDPPSGKKDPKMYFNPAAFSRIPLYTYGNVGRTTMIGPEAVSLDFSAMKKFPMLWEGHEVQLRIEAFNFPNRPNFGSPSSSLNSNSYTQISSTTTTMRQVQFSLKYVF